MILNNEENELLVKILERDELNNAYKLRYKIFCEELAWLPKNKHQEEKDLYDGKAIHFGAFDKDNLIGYARIVLPKETFMIEENFKDLIEGSDFSKKNDMIEISRLGAAKEYRNSENFGRIDILLCKYIYFWSLENNMRYWLMVVRPEYLNSIKNILPCRQIGPIKYYQKNIGTTAAIIDLRAAESYLLKENPALYKWFSPK